MTKTRGKLQCNLFFENCIFPRFFHVFFHFFIFFIIFHHLFYHFSSIPPLEAKMILKKMIKNEKNSRKIEIFHFLENVCTTGRKNDKNNDKKMIKKTDKK